MTICPTDRTERGPSGRGSPGAVGWSLRWPHRSRGGDAVRERGVQRGWGSPSREALTTQDQRRSRSKGRFTFPDWVAFPLPGTSQAGPAGRMPCVGRLIKPHAVKGVTSVVTVVQQWRQEGGQQTRFQRQRRRDSWACMLTHGSAGVTRFCAFLMGSTSSLRFSLVGDGVGEKSRGDLMWLPWGCGWP